MIIKSYEVKKNNALFLKYNFLLLYGENNGLKKDIKNFIISQLKNKNKNIEIISLYENEVLDNEDIFFNTIYSGSLFSQNKILIVNEATDKIIKKINDAYEKYPEDVFLVFFSNILEKKSKLRDFFEKKEKSICIPCYLDSEKDLEKIAQLELKKNNVILSREAINLLVEKSNSDRNNLRNEINKIVSYALNKKTIDLDEIKSLINFSGDYKSDILVNECLSGNITQYKKIVSDLYTNTVNQILVLRILSNKIHRLLKMKEKKDSSKNLDNLINECRPPIFWKEKPLVKKHLSIWNLDELKKVISDISNTELLCKKNPEISNIIFFNLFSGICKKASNFS